MEKVKDNINSGDAFKEQILKFINDYEKTSSTIISEKFNISHQEAVGILKGLEMINYVDLTLREVKRIALTPDGKETLLNGSPENVYVKFLQENGGKVNKTQITGKISNDAEVRGFSILMKLKVISFDKKTNEVSLPEGYKFDVSVDKNRDAIKKIESINEYIDAVDTETLNGLIKNKLVVVEVFKPFEVVKGKNFALHLVKQEADLTNDLIQHDIYKTKKFKNYNYKTKGTEVSNGSLHPLLRVRTQFREIMLELGFQEMPTNNFVESSFWNFDSLFQPQQHPARDAHDTFFLSHPKKSEKLREKYGEYLDNVKEMHQKGGSGSLGWRYNFSDEETHKNILRTHTTAVSSRMLYKLAQDYKETGIFTPKKYFSIDRVFRNETLDSTHLCEFHQIEGLVVDYNLGLGHLIGTIETFFKKFGIKKLRFKPAYNPYTEPSMEIFAYHEKLKRWVEIGNSGIFRPEMLLPMGLPKDVSVIAWGLSLERPTMIHYAFASIKELFGEEVQLRDTKNASLYCINIE